MVYQYLNKMSTEKLIYCSKLREKLDKLTLLSIKYEEKAIESLNDDEFKKNYNIYQDITSNLKYKEDLYINKCSKYHIYLSKLLFEVKNNELHK